MRTSGEHGWRTGKEYWQLGIDPQSPHARRAFQWRLLTGSINYQIPWLQMRYPRPQLCVQLHRQSGVAELLCDLATDPRVHAQRG